MCLSWFSGELDGNKYFAHAGGGGGYYYELRDQLKAFHLVTSTQKGDFMVDIKYVFEIGGHRKSNKQITGLENAYVAADNIEFARGNKIP